MPTPDSDSESTPLRRYSLLITGHTDPAFPRAVLAAVSELPQVESARLEAVSASGVELFVTLGEPDEDPQAFLDGVERLQVGATLIGIHYAVPAPELPGWKIEAEASDPPAYLAGLFDEPEPEPVQPVGADAGPDVGGAHAWVLQPPSPPLQGFSTSLGHIWFDHRVQNALVQLRIILFISIGTYVSVSRRVVEGGAFPFSSSGMAYLFRVRALAGELSDGHIFPQWTPDWYLGFPVVQYSSPAVPYLLSPIAAISDISTAYKLFTFLAFPLAGLLVGLLFRRELGSLGAIAAGLLYALSPWLLRTTFSDGIFPVTLFAVLLPAGMWMFVRLYTRPSPARFVAFSIFIALALLTEHFIAFMFIFLVILSAFAAAVLDNTGRLRSLQFVTGAVVIGIALSGFWVVPGLFQIDFPNAPGRGVPERVLAFSQSWGLFDITDRDNLIQPYFGVGIVILGVIGAFLARGRVLAQLLAVMAFLSLAMAFGENNPAVEKIGLLRTFIFFDRFLVIAAFSLALLAGFAVKEITDRVSRQSLAGPGVLAFAVVVLAIIYFEDRPSFDLVRNSDHEPLVAATAALDEAAPPGRLADFIGRPELAYYPAAAGRAALFGWAVENTPHKEFISLLNQAIRSGNDRFVRRQLQQWWTAGAYVLQGDPVVESALRAAGFSPGAVSGVVVPWARAEPVSIASLQTRNAFAVGRGGPVSLVAFPWLTVPQAAGIGAVNDARLAGSALAVFAEADADLPSAVDGSLSRFVSGGGTIMALLSNNPGDWSAGVKTEAVEFEETMLLVDHTGSVQDQPRPVSGFTTPGGPWRTRVVNDPRTQTLLSLRNSDGREFPLLSRLAAGRGSILIAGGSIHIQAFNSGDTTATTAIERILRSDIPGLFLGDTLPPVPVSESRIERGEIDITLDAGNSGSDVLLSVTAGPHWSSIKVDGQDAISSDYEGLVLVTVPPGIHEITLRQGATGSMWAGRVVSMAGLVALAAVVLYWRRLTSAELPTGMISRDTGGSLLSGMERLIDGLTGQMFGGVPESEPAEPPGPPESPEVKRTSEDDIGDPVQPASVPSDAAEGPEGPSRDVQDEP